MIKLFFSSFVFVCFFYTNAFCQKEVQTVLPDLSKEYVISGYHHTISGLAFQYHSPIPSVHKALISRATSGTMKVNWQTSPVPAEIKGEFVHFIWASGLGCNLGEKSFTLEIDQKEVLTFQTRSDSVWQVKTEQGIELGFISTMVDQYKDCFGFMYLRYPVKMLPADRCLNLQVTGEKANSGAWFMVFEKAIDMEPFIYDEQVLTKKEDRIYQHVSVNLIHLGEPTAMSLYVNESFAARTNLRFGSNVLSASLPAVQQDYQVELKLAISGRPIRAITYTLKPIKKREIHFLHHTHLDIGYTHHQDDVMHLQWQHMEKAIELAIKTQDYPAEAHFKWLPEGLWPVETYLDQASDSKRLALMDAIKKGWIGLDALYANELTALCSAEELLELVGYARRIRARYGFKVESAMISDVPGYSWGIVPVLAQSGVRYLSVGPNNGHRIGRTFLLADKPFYWQSPSGKEKILIWIHGKGYSWFHTALQTATEGMAIENKLTDTRIFDYLRELDEQHYPYDIIPIRYNVGSDNGPPDPRLPELVKSWNEQFESPKMVISLPVEMFHKFEEKYGMQLPVYSGDFTPYWEDGAASTARETALNRRTRERLVQAQTLWALLQPDQYPLEKINSAWRNILLYDEHTWGAWNSISDPDNDFVIQQWNWKKQRALESEHLVNEIFDHVLQSVITDQKKPNAVEVINTNPFTVSGLVALSKDSNRGRTSLRDDTGKEIAIQQMTDGSGVFLAGEVPGFGSRVFEVQEKSVINYPSGTLKVSASAIENEYYKISVSPEDGTINSFLLKTSGFELVLKDSPYSFGQYLYVDGRNPKDLQKQGKPVKITIKEKGPLVASLLVQPDAPGCNDMSCEIRMMEGMERIEIRYTLDRKRVRTPEGIHLVFPFNIPAGKIRLDIPWAVMQPESDQLAAACRNYLTIQNWVDISNDQFGITFISPDAPLIELGEIRTDAVEYGWTEKLEPTQTILSYIMNNYWETNYKADQPGVTSFDYIIKPHQTFNAAQVQQEALTICRPLIAVPVHAEKKASPSFISIHGDDSILISALKPAASGNGIIMRLFNTSDKKSAAEIILTKKYRSVFYSNLFEERLEPVRGSVKLDPMEFCTLLLTTD